MEGSAVVTTARRRLLVIDDDPLVARVIQRTLRSEHDVEAETDPRRALERLLAGETFDAILCDLSMPGVSGMAIHDAMVAQRPELAARFAFVTGGATQPATQAFLDGFQGPLLDKPFTPESLREVVARALALPR